MDSIPQLEEELQRLDRNWNQITTIPKSPRSLLHILNYSLGSQGQGEVFMTRILRYLLDSSEPHGMGDEFLRAFLKGLRAQQREETTSGVRAFEEDTYDLSEVEVSRQVQKGQATDRSDITVESAGLVDIVVELPGAWFLLIELKFSATENNLRGEGPSQTETYYQASHVGDQPKGAYESGGYYLYMHRRGKQPANDEHFSNWTWEAFDEDVLTHFIAENAARYPNRTVVQLREIHDDIQELTGMTEHQQNEQAKIELYLDHYDAIKDVTEAFDERWDRFAEEWAGRFSEVLSEAGYGEVVNVGDQLAGIEFERESGPETWIFRARNSDWAHLMKNGWWRGTEDLGTIHNRPPNRNDARIGFYHRLEANRDLAVGENTLQITFRNMGANDDEFIEAFNRNFRDRETEIVKHLPDAAELASVTDTRRNLIMSTYTIRPDDHEDFFTAYLAALREAFEDLVIENEALVGLIDDAFEEALDLYR